MNSAAPMDIVPGANGDTSLLEGLYQLVLDGATDSWEFEQLNAEVYGRLEAAYRIDAERAQPALAG